MTWRTGGGSEDMLLTKLREFGYAVVRGLCPLSLVQGATRCVVDRAMHALQLKGVPPGENMEGRTWLDGICRATCLLAMQPICRTAAL